MSRLTEEQRRKLAELLEHDVTFYAWLRMQPMDRRFGHGCLNCPLHDFVAEHVPPPDGMRWEVYSTGVEIGGSSKLAEREIAYDFQPAANGHAARWPRRFIERYDDEKHPSGLDAPSACVAVIDRLHAGRR